MAGIFQPNVFQHNVFQVFAFTSTISETQASQTSSAVAVERFIATLADSQSSQTAAITAREDFRATATWTQASQTESGAGLERFIATAAGSQKNQSETATGAERFIASLVLTQQSQTASITAQQGSTSVTGTIGTAQGSQSEIITAAGPDVTSPAQGWLHQAKVIGRAPARQQPKLKVAATTAQAAQSARLTAEVIEDIVPYLWELAA